MGDVGEMGEVARAPPAADPKSLEDAVFAVWEGRWFSGYYWTQRAGFPVKMTGSSSNLLAVVGAGVVALSEEGLCDSVADSLDGRGSKIAWAQRIWSSCVDESG